MRAFQTLRDRRNPNQPKRRAARAARLSSDPLLSAAADSDRERKKHIVQSVNLATNVDRTRNEWNFNVIPVENEQDAFDVFFDWQGRERRVCPGIIAHSEAAAITTLLANVKAHLNDSRFVERLSEVHSSDRPQRTVQRLRRPTAFVDQPVTERASQ